MRNIIGRLLHLANATKPAPRQEFYAMKEAILKRFGKVVGQDVQQITKVCWTCDGSGVYADTGRPCRRCYDGVFDRFWVYLTKWELGGYSFHVPSIMVHVKPSEPVNILGYVEHKSYGVKGNEAALLLALVFDRKLFWRMLRGSSYAFPGWWPLSNLQKLAMQTCVYLSRWKPRTCCCGRKFVRPFEPGLWFACRKCAPPVGSKAWKAMDKDVPF